jgi:hypothetical protein
MDRSLKRKLAAGTVAAGLVAGGGAALAATTGHGHSTSPAPAAGWFASARTGVFPGKPFGDDLAAAASYLGLTTDQLKTDLQSGKTLAQIADATGGKSAAGLIDALVAAETKELDAAVSAGKLTQAQEDTITANLKQRVTALVNGTFPARGEHRFGRHAELSAAASYLGLTVAQLRTQLEAGKTLAQIADATSGKSAAGLIDALVTATKTKLDAAVSAGKLTQAQEDTITANLKQLVTDLVNGTRPALAGPGFRGGWPGGAPPAQPGFAPKRGASA